MALVHRHIILNAHRLANPPQGSEEVTTWLQRMVRIIGMQELAPPRAERCDDRGNEGVTGDVLLKTSHASIHVWDQVAEPYLRFDLYSCARFGTGAILDLIREFQPGTMDWIVLDRDSLVPEIIEIGESRAPA